MLSLTSCGTNGLGISAFHRAVEYRPVVVDTGCKWTNIITVSSADVFTPVTARQILNHNETYERNCGADTEAQEAP